MYSPVTDTGILLQKYKKYRLVVLHHSDNMINIGEELV